MAAAICLGSNCGGCYMIGFVGVGVSCRVSICLGSILKWFLFHDLLRFDCCGLIFLVVFIGYCGCCGGQCGSGKVVWWWHW